MMSKIVWISRPSWSMAVLEIHAELHFLRFRSVSVDLGFDEKE
jgi:hypothetical protein